MVYHVYCSEYWDIADQEARRRITDDSVLYINPFDHPLIWDGHASIIDELKDINPSLIICCVGGGGLLLGILKGNINIINVVITNRRTGTKFDGFGSSSSNGDTWSTQFECNA